MCIVQQNRSQFYEFFKNSVKNTQNILVIKKIYLILQCETTRALVAISPESSSETNGNSVELLTLNIQ